MAKGMAEGAGSPRVPGCGVWALLMGALFGVAVVGLVALLPLVGVWWGLVLAVSLGVLVPVLSWGLARWLS